MTLPTLDPELDGFLTLLAARRAPRTVEAYRRDLAQLGEWLGHRVSSASTAELEGWIAQMRSDGRAATTVARRIAAARAFYRHQMLLGARVDNPAAALAPHPRLAFPAPTGERGGVLLVCEGLPDALVASQEGFRAVAILGAQTPDATVAARIANHAANLDLAVAVVHDTDPAGRSLATNLAPRRTE